jgi:hypothetical protein
LKIASKFEKTSYIKRKKGATTGATVSKLEVLKPKKKNTSWFP